MSGTKFDVDVIAAGESTVLLFPDGAVIFEHDEVSDCAYIVKSGEVVIGGRGRAVERIEPGEIFGATALLDDGRTVAAIAAGQVELVPIDRQTFTVLLRDDPDFAMTILRLMARRLRAAMRMLDGRPDDLPVTGEPERRSAARA